MRRWSGRWEAGLVVAALALYAGLAVDGLCRQSATFDEGAHLPAGYTALVFGDHRLNLEHPPLVKLLAAAPLLALEPVVRTQDESWREGRQWRFGHRFLYRWNDADRLLFWGRLPVVALGCLLALAVWLWARLHWGPQVAAAALGLCVLCPDVLAHGQLVTTDVGFTLFFFLTVVAFERLTDRGSWRWLAAAGLALGAAAAAKFSAVVLAPVLVALALAAAVGQGRKASRVLGSLVAMGAIALAVVWAVYRFRFGISPDPAASALLDWGLVTPPPGMVRSAAAFLREHRLLPEGYLFGFLQVFRLSAERPAFLLGEVSATGWWYYFPVTFLLKTPLPLLALTGLGLASSVRRVLRGATEARRLEMFLWIPVAVYWLVTLTRNLNIGHRHLLPIYPFLFVAAGRAAVWMWERGRKDPGGEKAWWAARPAVALLGLWSAGSALWIHPHHLAYFNELAGGPSRGYRLLADSNLDWGQDLENLKRYLERAGIPRVKLSYFGTADPRYYGIPGDLLPGHILPAPERLVRRIEPGDVLAISATNLQGLYLDDPRMLPLMAELRRREPFAQVGYSILLYRADFAWSPRGGFVPAAERSGR